MHAHTHTHHHRHPLLPFQFFHMVILPMERHSYTACHWFPPKDHNLKRNTSISQLVHLILLAKKCKNKLLYNIKDHLFIQGISELLQAITPTGTILWDWWERVEVVIYIYIFNTICMAMNRRKCIKGNRIKNSLVQSHTLGKKWHFSLWYGRLPGTVLVVR